MSNSYNWTFGQYPNGHMSNCPIAQLDIVGFGQCPNYSIGQLDICPNPIGHMFISNWTIGYYLYELLNLIRDSPKNQ